MLRKRRRLGRRSEEEKILEDSNGIYARRISLLSYRALYIQDEAFRNCFKTHKKVLRARAIKIMLDDWRRSSFPSSPSHSLFVCNFPAIIFPVHSFGIFWINRNLSSASLFIFHFSGGKQPEIS